MKEQDLKELAGAVHQYLGARGSVVSVSEMAEEIGFSRHGWTDIRLELLLNGVPVCRAARGYYIGEPGEQVTALTAEAKDTKARLATITRQLEALDKAGQLRLVRDRAKLEGHEPIGRTMPILQAAGHKFTRRVMRLLGAG